ncbi:MAG: hypothetical protein JOZ73_04650 [Solirubrobacterales bacterium]|nr:hypothetical protein [Solirubrobacterales bacterium]
MSDERPWALLRRLNAGMILFDLILGSATLLAPAHTLRLLGHDSPSTDALHLFRRCGPIWLTFAAAHGVANARGNPEDWWALSWLRATEIATDAVWAQSPAVSRRGAKLALRLAGAFNFATATGFAALARGTRSP